MTITILLAAVLVAACALIARLLLELGTERRHNERLRTLLQTARREAMAAEARSRNVGGTGEHGAPIVTPVEPVSRVWSMGRDPRWTIPSDRVR